MDELFKVAIQWTRENWSSPLAIVSSALLVLVVLLAGFARITLEGISRLEWGITGTAVLAVVLLLAWVRRTPRHPRDRVGLGIAVSCQDQGHLNVLRSDFITEVRRLIDDADADSSMSIIEFPQRISSARQSKEWARQLAHSSRSHLLLWGDARLRRIEGRDRHVLRVSGLVRHGPVSKSISQHFSREMSQVLPSQFWVDTENDMIGLELTADYLSLVAAYIVGNAAAITGDFNLALKFYERVEELLSVGGNPSHPVAAKIKNILPRRIAAGHSALIKWHYSLFWRDYDADHLAQAEAHVPRVLEIRPDDYGAKLISGICHFCLRNDVNAALDVINSCASVGDNTWRYSAAFLEAYRGDLNAAYEHYKRAFYRPPEDKTVPLQAEEFIHHILATHEGVPQLWFCLGIINERGKLDSVAASQDFKEFLARTSAEDFPLQHEKVREWLARMEAIE